VKRRMMAPSAPRTMICSPPLERLPANAPATTGSTPGSRRAAKAAVFSTTTIRPPGGRSRKAGGAELKSNATASSSFTPVRSTVWVREMFMSSMNSKSLPLLNPRATSSGVGSGGW